MSAPSPGNAIASAPGETALPFDMPGELSALTRLKIRLHQWRNRLIASDSFQRFAARTPGIRRIANQRALALHHITAGFVYSQVMHACLDVRLFSRLSAGPLTTQFLAEQCDLPAEGMERLLLAARGLGLVERYTDDLWGLGELGASTEAYPGIEAMVRHHQLLYRDLSTPVELFRSAARSELSGYWPYGEAESDQQRAEHAAYSDLMAISQPLIADHILDAYPLTAGSRLVDVAGGTGAFARAALARYPNLSATVLELPEVVDHAECEPQNRDLAIEFRSVDLFRDNFDLEADLVTLVRILHDHDDGGALAILRALFRACRPGTRLLIAEPLAETPGAEAIGDTYFGTYLWAMGSGRPRSAAQLKAWLAREGWTEIREIRSNMPCLVRIIVATRADVEKS